MSRNGSGTYSTVNTFSPGQTIASSSLNANFSDIATELTNSVAADGQTMMTGPLKASNGTAAAPSQTFASDTDTGFYRSAANEISGAVGGAQTFKVSSAGVDAVAGRVLQAGASLVPAGTIIYYAGSAAPTGWLVCNGSAVSRTTYADLFTAISTTYGTGDGSTTFNLPDCTGRTIAGKEASGTRLTTAVSGVDGGTLGSAGGAQSVTLAQANLPNVSPTFTGTPVTPTFAAGAAGATVYSSGGSTFQTSAGSTSIQLQNATISPITPAGTISSMNGGVTQTAINKLPPVIVLNCLIKY